MLAMFAEGEKRGSYLRGGKNAVQKREKSVTVLRQISRKKGERERGADVLQILGEGREKESLEGKSTGPRAQINLLYEREGGGKGQHANF